MSAVLWLLAAQIGAAAVLVAALSIADLLWRRARGAGR